MDWHIETGAYPRFLTPRRSFEAAIQAARSNSYFSTFTSLYYIVWRDNRRRISTTHSRPHRPAPNAYGAMTTKQTKIKRAIFVCDASIAQHEIRSPVGDRWIISNLNQTPNQPWRPWLKRVVEPWPRSVLINPTPTGPWD